MDFRLLGPLEVRADGRPLPLGGPKQRAVLAMLLLHAGEVVSTDRLIDEIWGERPPKTVHAYVQNCISRLRPVLGRELIEMRPPGYVLWADEKSIDAVRFADAVAAAPALEPPERAAALREALGLWRGTPFADLAFETFPQGEIARLEELRLVALEERLAAELELGRHTEILGELTALANRHPSRERLRYLQMLSLYRSGRQREALRVYQDTRRELVEELGLEPGEELRTLERLIISHDAELGIATAAAPEEDLRRVAVLAIELVGAADAIPDTIENVVSRHGGILRELLTDEAVALFAGHDDGVLRALRAATELRESLPPGVRARIVVDRRAGNVAGITELLHAADVENLLIGGDALALVPAAVDVVPHETGAFRVLRFDPAAEPFARHFELPLIARTSELDILDAELDDAVATGTARRLVLVGEAGVGKTRLVQEFARRVGRRARVLGGRCVAYGEGVALLPLLQIVGRVDDLDSVLKGEEDAGRVAERLRDPAAFDRSEGFWAFRRLLESLSRQLPVVVILEDLQWAAGTFLDLVDYLDGWTAAPVLLVCVGRLELLERRPEWRDDGFLLEPLTVLAAREFAAALPEYGRLDAAAVERAVEASEGNPLFLEQFVASETELVPGTVPPTLEALIAGRLDALAPAERAALERAAVAGRGFWRAVVEDATPPEERDAVGSSLMSLVRRRLVHPERSALEGEDGFRFHHALIRDVAYAGIPEAMRAELHESVARSLDGRHAALDELVGHHLEQAALLRGDADLRREAGHRLGVAGMRAMKRVDGPAAADLLSRAISLLGDDPAALELEWGLATAIKFGGDWVEASSRLTQVASEAARQGDRVIELRARIEQVWPELAGGRLEAEEALAFLGQAGGELDAAADVLGLGRVRHLEAAVLGTYLFRSKDAELAAVQAAESYARCGFPAGTGVVALAVPVYRGPTVVPEAIDRYRALLAECETPVWASFLLPFLAVAEAMEGRFDDARSHLLEARVGREEFADNGTIVTSWSALAGEVELLAGRADQAEAVLAASVEVLRDGGDAGWLATNTAWLAEAQYRLGRFEEALQLSADARVTAPRGHLTSLSVSDRVHAKSLARAGRIDEARLLALENVARLAQTDAFDERGEAAAACAEVLALAGDDAGSDKQAAAAIACFRDKGNLVSAARVAADMQNWGKPG